MWKRVAVVAAAVAVLAIAGAGIAYWLMGRPLYEPGSVRAGVNVPEPLEPPAVASADPAFFQVTKDVRLFTFSEGSGEDLLVVHGGPGYPPAGPWPAGAGLSDRYRLVYYHQRGCGESTRPITRLPGESLWRELGELHTRLGLPAQIADIERIRHLLGRERLVLVGHSFGALIAALYAAEFPQRVSALVLVAPEPLFVHPVDGGDLFERVAARLPAPQAREFEAWRSEFLDFGTRLREPDDVLAERYARFGPFYAAAVGIAPRTTPARPGGLMPYAVFVGLGRSHDWRRALARVTAPVLVLHGAKDLQSEEQTRGVAGLFASARFAVIPGAGHVIQEDAPAELARAVREFLAAR